MRCFRAALLRLLGVFAKRKREIDLADELESHLQMHIEDNLRSGMSHAQARRDALQRLGGMVRVREACREATSLPALDHLLQDLRFAFRQLRKNPGFTAAAILTLGLGTCAAVAIFAFVDAALLRPLPYREPARLAGVFEKVPLCPLCNLSYPDYLDWKGLNTVFASLEVYQRGGVTLNGPEGARPARSARVSSGFFRTLGVAPGLGRDFRPGDDSLAAAPVALLSDAAWRQRFGGSSDVLGRSVTLDGVAYVIAGVLPRDFHFAPVGPAEFWIPLRPDSPCMQRRSCHSIYGVARLKDGISIETAAANTRLIAAQLEKQYPDSNRGQGAAVVALSDIIVGEIRPVLLILLAGAGLLLLIANVNVASLLLLRSESRRKEIAVRSALGGSAARLFSQFATEGLALAAAGGALGALGGYWATRLLVRLVPAELMAGMTYLNGVGMTPRTLAFIAGITLLSALLYAVIPAARAPLGGAREGLAEAGRGSSGTTWRRAGSRLVTLELATAVVLLVGAGLLARSLHRLLQTDLGFDPERLAVMAVAAPDSAYSTNEQMVALERAILREVTSLPGVVSAGLTSVPPVLGGNTWWIKVPGRPDTGEHNEVQYREISADYLQTLRARLVRGRFFREDDDASKPAVTVIDSSLAAKYFPGEDPIGKQLQRASVASPPKEIIGVVEEIREGALDRATWPTMYVPFNQEPDTYFALFVRTSQDAGAILPSLAATVHRVDPGISTMRESTMRRMIADSPAAYLRHTAAWLVGAFAAAALVLSMVGLYGVVAYSVSRRTREIGIRMALGAQPRAVRRMVVQEAGGLALLGIALGLVCAVPAGSLLRALLFGVRSWDAATLAGASAALALAALLASYLPARRAASVDPAGVLRME